MKSSTIVLIHELLKKELEDKSAEAKRIAQALEEGKSAGWTPEQIKKWESFAGAAWLEVSLTRTAFRDFLAEEWAAAQKFPRSRKDMQAADQRLRQLAQELFEE